MTQKFTFIDLFAGIGGFHHALASLGGECVLACEIDDQARSVYEGSFPRKRGGNYRFVRNVRTLTRRDVNDDKTAKTIRELRRSVPRHDLLCGGFPCQPFSKSGSQLGALDQTRGTLFHDILKIVEARRPKYLFLENVKNLAGPRHKSTWKTITQSLRNQGYNVTDKPMIFSPHLLPPKMGGAPQVRERIFIFGIRDDLDSNPLCELERFNQQLRAEIFMDPDSWSIADYLLPDSEIENGCGYRISDAEAMYVEAWNYFVERIPAQRLPGFPLWAHAFTPTPDLRNEMPGWEVIFRRKNSEFYREYHTFIDAWSKKTWGIYKLQVSDFPISRQKFEWQASKRYPTSEGRSLHDLVLQFRPSGIRVKSPTYLPALVAIAQTPVVGPGLRRYQSLGFRKITPVEAARLQSFPDFVFREFAGSDLSAYKQLGNAVNVGIVRTAANILLGGDVDGTFTRRRSQT